MDSCLESYICSYCQLSRQFNMLYNNEPAVHFPICLLVSFLDSTVTNVVGCLFLLTLRQNIRKRFGIRGSTLQDVCVSCWCAPCALQQQLLELTSLGMFPGACFYAVAPL
uniref:Cell number regulator 4 n=1 Tax=Lygus hesperus TaxID=30085 RepID=A0A0A9XK78_LYGHE